MTVIKCLKCLDIFESVLFCFVFYFHFHHNKYQITFTKSLNCKRRAHTQAEEEREEKKMIEKNAMSVRKTMKEETKENC